MVRLRYGIFLFSMIVMSGMIGCSSSPTVNQSGGPILLQEMTIAPTAAVPTRPLTNTPSPTTSFETPPPIVTIESGFMLITPTLPPSKTPTMTPTITATPSITPIIIPTLLPTTTMPAGFATSVIMPLTNLPPTPFSPPNINLNPPPIGVFTTPTPNTSMPMPCQFSWFFANPQPLVCPLSMVTMSPAAFQQFENGFMIWMGTQDAIYVMYNDMLPPRWQVFRDNYEEGMPADDPMYNTPLTPNTYQPRRGFGLLWRNNEVIRNRIGWAIMSDEIPYNAQNQTGADSTLFISDPQNGVFMLLPQGIEWQRFVNVGVMIP